VPIRPAAEDLAAARSLLLEDLLVDFPFTADSDRAHAVAAILLPFARRMFEGPAPIHLIEAPSAGSGKTLLAELIATVALGEAAGSKTISNDESELRKAITAMLSEGSPIISIDNIKGGLWSSQIASAITAGKWVDRRLGKSETITCRNRALWLVTGNNPDLSQEIARRCIRIRLNPPEDRSSKKRAYKHDPIRGWAQQQHTELARAVLTIIRSWIAAGAPMAAPSRDSFETWSHMIGGMIEHLGLPGFLGNEDEFFDAADAETGDWRAFVAAWWARHRDQPVRVRELLALAEENDLIAFACAGQSDTARKSKLGKALNGLRGRKFEDLEVLITMDSHSKSRQYRLRSPGSELFPADGGAS